MSVAPGKSPLSLLRTLPTHNTGLPQGFVNKLINTVDKAYRQRCEFIGGGEVSAGAGLSGSALRLTFASGVWLASLLNGVPTNSPVATSDTNLDVLAAAGVVAQAIYEDGADASGHAISSDESTYFALISCNTDGAGDVGGSAKLLAVIAGTAATYNAQEAPPTTASIARALAAATGVHDGVTAWIWLFHGHWTRPSGTAAVAVTANINNILDR